jgi:predicted nucleic acid-binding protein
MTIVFDTNVILDALLERKPFHAEAEQLLTACVGKHVGCFTANGMADIFYVLAKSIGAVQAKQAVRKLMELLVVIAVNAEDCVNALDLPMNDFEDALVSVCAMRYGAECVVSRDNAFINANGPIHVMPPAELLAAPTFYIDTTPYP